MNGLARTLMVQGTASSAGKSLLVTALCRIYRRRGLRVAPFKSQNMALNSFVTPDGLEIGRAQAVQAEACGIPPQVEMNPILLKPEGEMKSQVVVLGQPVGGMSASRYHAFKAELRQTLAGALQRLREQFELVIIEGAGSPAEINLREQDIANMHVARVADAPVLLVGDIDRGGVFAAFLGTLELLLPDERERVAGFIVNKFRGDLSLLAPGLDFLRERTGVPVLGVVPYIHGLRIADEDSLGLERRRGRRAALDQLDLAVVRLPRISNHDDFDALEHEPGVVVRYVERAAELNRPDLVVLPGSKSTVADLAWLRERGFAPLLAERAAAGLPLLGICGGCQMLGRTIEDPLRVESDQVRVPGLDLLPIATRYQPDKRTRQVTARAAAPSWLTDGLPCGEDLAGYQIHMGRIAGDAPAPFELLAPEPGFDGAVAAGGAVVGTLLHGLLENESVRRSLLDHLRRRRGLARPAGAGVPSREEEYDRLAAVVQQSLDLDLLDRIIARDGG